MNKVNYSNNLPAAARSTFTIIHCPDQKIKPGRHAIRDRYFRTTNTVFFQSVFPGEIRHAVPQKPHLNNLNQYTLERRNNANLQRPTTGVGLKTDFPSRVVCTDNGVYGVIYKLIRHKGCSNYIGPDLQLPMGQ